ncbi:MAG: FG-GAP repeat protein [Marinicellaceae bacterium]
MYKLLIVSQLLLLSLTSFAQDQRGISIDERKIFPSQDIDSFGGTVSVSGNRALVGGNRGGPVNGAGAAYIFEFDGTNWNETDLLTASDFDFGDEFGTAVSLLGNRAAISATEDENGKGAVYIFEFDGNNWVETAKITSDDSLEDDNFGFSLSLSVDNVMIGAPFHNRSESPLDADTGAAYIYNFNGTIWQQAIKLSPNSDVGALFGNSVSLSGNRAVGGAPNDGILSGEPGGSAYVYQFNGTNWIADGTLKPSDVMDTTGFFGHSVDVSNNRIIVGDYIRSQAYIYERQNNSWNETEIIAKGGDAFFGYSVRLFGDTAYIGEPNDDNLTGKVYRYSRNGQDWAENLMFTASDGMQADSYGFSLDFDGSNLIIGAPGGNENNSSRPAAAYLYNFDSIFKNGFESILN